MYAAISGERGINTTVIACVRTSGQYVPPFIIFKGKRANEMLKHGAPPGSYFALTPTGYIDGDLFCKKNLEGCGDGSPLVSVGVAPIGTVGAFRLHYLPLAPQKSRTTMMAYYKNDGLDPVGAPTYLRKQEVGKPRRNAAQPCAVYDDPSRGDELRDGVYLVNVVYC